MEFILKLSDSTNRQRNEIKWEEHHSKLLRGLKYCVWFASTADNEVEFEKEYTLEITADGQRSSIKIPLR